MCRLGGSPRLLLFDLFSGPD